MSVLKNFFKNLKEIKGEDEGFVTRVAKASGLSRGSVNNFVLGRGDPTLSNAEAVANAAGASLAEMIGNERPEFAAPRDPTPEEISMRALDGLKLPEQKEAAIRVILENPDAVEILNLAQKIGFHHAKRMLSIKAEGKSFPEVDEVIDGYEEKLKLLTDEKEHLEVKLKKLETELNSAHAKIDNKRE